MKALSLTQPWATLVQIGAKRIETRNWNTSYRGPLAIAASKGFPGWAKGFCEASVVCDVLGWARLPKNLTQAALDDHSRLIKSLPTGVVLAICALIDCLPMESFNCLPGIFDDYPELDTPKERAFGNFDLIDQSGRRRWAWVLEDIRPLERPIPAKGSSGLWEWTEVPAHEAEAEVKCGGLFG